LLLSLKNSEIFEKISQIKDLNMYFSERKEALLRVKEDLKNQFSAIELINE
jgi:hypothetical protein